MLNLPQIIDVAGCGDVSKCLPVTVQLHFMQRNFSPDEKEMLLLLKQGHEAGFEKIYKLYSTRLFGNIFKMVKSDAIAQEILQEVFIKVWNNRTVIDPERSFRSYIFRIAENSVYDYFRNASRVKKMRTHILAVAIEQYDHIDELLLRKENNAILDKAISSLSPQRQLVFRLCKLEGQSYVEVGRELGISVSTISDHIVKANKTIREYLLDNMDKEI